MQPIIMNVVAVLAFASAAVALFFFSVTRGALLMRVFSANTAGASSHIYPLYSNMRLIRLVDHQPIISAILLFQYDRLVDRIVSGLEQADLSGKTVLITSCAFGDVIPRVVKAALDSGAEQVLVSDIVDNELINARRKLREFEDRIEYLEEDATAMRLGDGVVDVNIVFFLMHELPHHLKEPAMREASRVVAPRGTLYLAEFHRPDSPLLRLCSWAYFKVFEPYGLALWDTHDPLDWLQVAGGWDCERYTCCHGNFQVISATRP
jgi:ubiquinone/menaquinone biosynthesis C-methylase UbiE